MRFEFKVKLADGTETWMQIMGGGGPVGNGCLHAVEGKSAVQMADLCATLLRRVRTAAARKGEIRQWSDDAPLAERITVHRDAVAVTEARFVP